MNASLGQSPALKQRQQLTPQLLQGVRLLEKPLPELRAEIIAEISANPAIEDLDNVLETPLSEVERDRLRERSADESDYPLDDFEPGVNHDEEAAERRQALFDRQTKGETLQEHLLKQLPLSGIRRADWPMAVALVDDLNDDGFYCGSLPDLQMAFGCDERKLLSLLGAIMALDPVGCGARTARECLMAQLDDREATPVVRLARRIADTQLERLAAGDRGGIAAALGVGEAELDAAVKLLLTLDPHPGRGYLGERNRVEYVNPEVHAVKRCGQWLARTDRRSLPEIRISKSFEAMLKDPRQSAETKDFVRSRIAAAKTLREAVVRRRDTVEAVAQEIFDRQAGYFEKGVAGLKPLTEREIAEAVGVTPSTVSRAVRDKYALTPFGTIELRRFFPIGVKNADGEEISQAAVQALLGKIVAEEDARTPLSDEKLAERLKAAGYPIARRTVAKYRARLAIPGASERQRGETAAAGAGKG